MEQHLQCSIPLVNSMTSSLLQKKGKAIRSELTMALAQALEQPLTQTQEQDLILCCAIIEMIHSGTLVHDDVIDTSKTRRGQLASHEVFGNTCSVLLGDYLFTKAFSLAFQLSESQKFLFELSEATGLLVEGELLQIEYSHKKSTCWKTYEKIILYKTAVLFKLSALSTSLFCQPTKTDLYAHLGTQIGLFFQKVDDYLDYFSTQEILGKEPGSDFKEKKMTYPILIALRDDPTLSQVFFFAEQTFESFHKKLLSHQQAIFDDLAQSFESLMSYAKSHLEKNQFYVVQSLLIKIFSRTERVGVDSVVVQSMEK